MVTRTLTCEKTDCPFHIQVAGANTETNRVLYDYGEINPTLGQARELTCLICGSPMKAKKSLKVRLQKDDK